MHSAHFNDLSYKMNKKLMLGSVVICGADTQLSSSGSSHETPTTDSVCQSRCSTARYQDVLTFHVSPSICLFIINSHVYIVAC